MIHGFNIGDKAVIKAFEGFIRPEYHGKSGEVLAIIRSSLGHALIVFLLDEPYINPVFVSPIATITIGPDLLDRAV